MTATGPPASNLIELSDGEDLCWAEYGDRNGQPVFVFHGNPGSRLAWGAMPGSPFLEGVRLVAPDRPGYGKTDFKALALERWPNDMVEYWRHLTPGMKAASIYVCTMCNYLIR